MNNLGLLERNNTVFVLVDMQEKLLPAMYGADVLISNSNILVKAANVLKIPLIVTEQYPKGLGKTSERIQLPSGSYVIEKISFGCFGSEDFMAKLKKLKRKSLVLFGVEAHVCILKTALEALNRGYEVHIAADAIASRTAENRSVAIERMRQSGAYIVPTETVLFQLMDKSGTDEFKALSRLIR